jgi:ribosomal-protein-alanine N-acetyltransferase
MHALFRNFADPEVAKWFFEHPYTEIAQASQIIDAFKDEFEQGQGITWAITFKGTGTFVGTCGYGEVHIADRGEVGFDLAKEHWGKGLMTEALTAIIDYGFDILDLNQVEAHTYSNNARAKRLLEKLGFQLQTVSTDSHYFALSSQDWET